MALAIGGQRRFSDRFGLARERHHAPVVVRVAVAIQHLGACDAIHRRD